MAQVLEITESMDGTTHKLMLAGRLDTNTSPQLEAEANRIYQAEAAPDIVVEMGACEFVSSAGLRVIVAMQKHAATGGSLTFRNVVPDVMDVFAMTGFDSILTIE